MIGSKGLSGPFLSRVSHFSIPNILQAPTEGGRLVGRTSWWRDSAKTSSLSIKALLFYGRNERNV